MEQKYIQLPPLPSDMPLESIEMIWLYAQMSDEKRAELMVQDLLFRETVMLCLHRSVIRMRQTH